MNGSAECQSTRHDHLGDRVVSLHLEILLVLVLVFASFLSHAAATAKQVAIVKSSDDAVYDSVIESLERQLEAVCLSAQPACPAIEIHSFTADADQAVPASPDLVLTLGLKARDYAERHFAEARILNAMIPTRNGQLSESADQRLDHPTLILDQPPARSLLLIKHLIPSSDRIGLLISRDNTARAAALGKAAEALELRLMVNIVDDETKLGKQLAAILDEIDILLALPDLKIHNRRNVSSILLTTYRNRIPLIGFSSAYVKAGALAAVYSTPENIATQLAELIVRDLTVDAIPKRIIYPKYFSVSVNSRVARSLGIQLQWDSDKLEQLIKDAEQ